MKIIHVTPTYVPAFRYGGPIWTTHGLAKSSVDLGHEVYVITTNVDGPGTLATPIELPIQVEGVEVRYFPTAFGRRLYRSPQMGQALKALIPEVDLVHIQAVYLWPGYAASRIARRVGVPYVVSPHGMLTPELIAQKSTLLKKAWIRLVERRTLAHAAAIHVTSETEAVGIRQLGLDLAPLRVASHGVDLPADPPGADEIAAAWHSVPEGRRVLFLGRISWKKGIDLLIEAVARTSGAVLRIAGNDEEGLTPKLRRLAEQSGVADRTDFSGPVEGARKWALIAGADVMVTPSVNENFGIVVAEALGVGTPVICTPDVGAGWIVAEIDPSCVVARDADALAAAIHALLEDPERRGRIGEQGRKIIAARYSWPVIAQRMLGLYSEAIESDLRP